MLFDRFTSSTHIALYCSWRTCVSLIAPCGSHIVNVANISSKFYTKPRAWPTLRFAVLIVGKRGDRTSEFLLKRLKAPLFLVPLVFTG